MGKNVNVKRINVSHSFVQQIFSYPTLVVSNKDDIWKTLIPTVWEVDTDKNSGVLQLTLIRVVTEHGVSRDCSLVLYNESSDSLWESLLRGFQKN